MFLCHFLYTLLCSRCGYFSSKLQSEQGFLFFFVGGQKIFLTNSLYLQIKYYLCIGLAIKQLIKIRKNDNNRAKTKENSI